MVSAGLHRLTIAASALLVVVVCCGANTEEPSPVWERLAPTQRAKVLAALAAFVILGLALMFLAWLGAKATRRYMNREAMVRKRPPVATPLREKDWANKPLTPPLDDETP